MMNPKIPNEKKQRILELYLCSNEKRLLQIAQVVGSNSKSVSNVISEYFDKKIVFERGEYFIYHSSMNSL